MMDMFPLKRWQFSALIAVLAMVLLTFAPLAVAHDASLHKGKATEGEIVSIAESKIRLKTATGTLAVVLSAKTKYEHGGKAVTKSHLQKGERVSVFGTKLATGELVASEVLIGGAAPESHHK